MNRVHNLQKREEVKLGFADNREMDYDQDQSKMKVTLCSVNPTHVANHNLFAFVSLVSLASFKN